MNIVNNIFSASGAGLACNYYSPAAIGTCDYNNYYSPGNYLGSWNNVSYMTLAELQAASGKDANSQPWYPHFVSASDLHTPSPWMNAKGTPLASVSDDIDGQVRDGSTPDIGADEFTPTAPAPLAGVYTIGGTSPSYTTMAAAVADGLLRGVSDTVRFQFRNGVYTVHPVIQAFPGVVASKPVYFESESGNSSAVTLFYGATVADSNYVVRLYGADYFRFERLSMAGSTASGSPYSLMMWLDGGVEDYQMRSCILNGPPSVAGTNQTGIYAYQSLYRNRTITGNTFNYGGYGLYITGLSTNVLSSGTVITSNTFANQGWGGVNLTNQDAPVISGNVVTGAGQRGFELGNCDNGLVVTKNKATVSATYAFYLYNSTGGTGLPVARGLIANNFFVGTGTTSYGVYLYNNVYQDFYHNSINVTSTGAGLYLYAGSGNNMNLVNNIFSASGGGLAYNIYTPAAVGTTDFNDIYSSGATLASWANVSQADLAALRTASGKEAGSVSRNPVYSSSSDLHRTSGALDTIATPLAAVTDDIDGELRDPVKPDIGADERYPLPTIPSISISDASVTEGNSGSKGAVFTVSLSDVASSTVTVNWATSDGLATAGSDYASASGTWTFPQGTTSITDSVMVTGDALNEPNETFFVSLTSPTNATLSDSLGTGTILNDDPVPAISISDVTVSEGNSGTTDAIFAVSLSTVSGQLVTVSYTTANGTASSGSDYVAKTGLLSFLAGTTLVNDTIKVNGDITVEPSETFFVNLTSPANATIADNQGIGTISNDDEVILGSIAGQKWHDRNGNGGREGNEEGLANWTITATGRTGSPLSTTTDTAGNYAFLSLPPDTYKVSESPVEGWFQTVGQPVYTIVINGDHVTGVDFANAFRGSIAGAKFSDIDGNGTREELEQGLPGWSICLEPVVLVPDVDFNQATASMNFTIGQSTPYQVSLIGGVSIRRGDPEVSSNSIPTEMIGLTLTSATPIRYNSEFYDVIVTTYPGLNGKRSFGAIAGNGTAFPAASSFDLFMDVTLRGRSGGLVAMKNVLALHIAGSVNQIPLGAGTTFTGAGVALGDKISGSTVGALQSMGIVLGDAVSAGKPVCTLTDAGGNYQFAPLPPGTYLIRELQQNGWLQTSTNPDAIVIESGTDSAGVDFGNQLQLGVLEGIKYDDANGNGVRDNGEIGLRNWTIKLSGLNWTDITDDSGKYAFVSVPAGSYTLSEVQQSGWLQTEPSGSTHSVALAGGQTISGLNFGNKQNAGVKNLKVDLAGGRARPGFVKKYCIQYWNRTSTSQAATVVFTLPQQYVTYDSSSRNGVYDGNTKTVTWDLGTLVPHKWGLLKVYVTVDPTTPLRTELTSSVKIEPVAGDTYPENNFDSETQRVTGSFDPNDKTVWPEGAGAEHIVSLQDTLNYRIRFQNVGNDTAFNIVVLDTLDANLDASSIELGAASHPYSFSIVEGNIMRWAFNDILLVDSTTNEPESHGFAWFRIRPVDGTQLGTVVQNSASVYFDFNSPVLTNTVINRFDTLSVGVREEGIPAALTLYQNYPNPFNPTTSISYELLGTTQVNLTVYTMLGQAVVTLVDEVQQSGLHTAILDAKNLPSGVYFYRLQAGSHIETRKLTLMK
jgi:uncharacterized repeat protein (TIGR01451 family)